MKIFTIISALMLSFTSFAAHTGEIAILSNSGEKFYVAMDGTFQNYQPKSNVRVQAIGNSMYNFKVYALGNNFRFDRNIIVRPNTRITYKIVERYGHYTLRFHSESPMYGGSGTFNGQGGGQGGCIHHPPQHQDPYVDPYANGGMDVYYTGGYGQNNYYGSAYMLSNADFDNLKQAIQRESFSDDKLRIAKRAAKDKRFTARQVRDIARLFTFSSEQLAFAKAAYPNCVDKQNYYEVMEVFTFSSDKDALEAFIDAQ